MKTHRILTTVFALAAVMASTSCLKNQKDVFDNPVSQRKAQMMDDVKAILQKPSNGWALAYYPGSTSKTSTYVLEFTSSQVTATNEFDPDSTVTSYYKLSLFDGVMLSFDTYNPVLHKWAEPSSGSYQGHGGDFEFNIQSYSDDLIVMKGTRSGNVCTMTPLSEKKEDFFEAVNAMNKKFDFAAFSATISGHEVEGYIDSGTRTITVGDKGQDELEMTKVRYVVTKEGIHLAKEVNLYDVVLSDLTYDEANDKLLNADKTVFDRMIPQGWISYQDYLGGFEFNFTDSSGNPGSIDVTLEADEEGSSFKMVGLSSGWNLPVRYNSGRGNLSINVQCVATTATHQIWFCALDGGANSFSWSTDAGMVTTCEDNSIPNFTVKFKDNGEYDGLKMASFYVTAFKGTPSSSTYDYSGLPDDCYFSNGGSYLQGPLSMTKK